MPKLRKGGLSAPGPEFPKYKGSGSSVRDTGAHKTPLIKWTPQAVQMFKYWNAAGSFYRNHRKQIWYKLLNIKQPMKTPTLFEFVILFHPGKDEKDTKSKILIERTTILAVDLPAANIIAARAIPEEYVSKLENIIVAIRPF